MDASEGLRAFGDGPGCQELVVLQPLPVMQYRGLRADVEPGVDLRAAVQHPAVVPDGQLGVQRGPAVEHRGDPPAAIGTHQEPPVPVVAVEVAYQGVHDEHVPVEADELPRVHPALLPKGQQYAVQFRPRTAILRREARVLDIQERHEARSPFCEVPAGHDGLSPAVLESVCSEQGLLGRHAGRPEHHASQMLRHASVGVPVVAVLRMGSGRELQHVQVPVVLDAHLPSVGPAVDPEPVHGAVAEVDHPRHRSSISISGGPPAPL